MALVEQGFNLKLTRIKLETNPIMPKIVVKKPIILWLGIEFYSSISIINEGLNIPRCNYNRAYSRRRCLELIWCTSTHVIESSSSVWKNDIL